MSRYLIVGMSALLAACGGATEETPIFPEQEYTPAPVVIASPERNTTDEAYVPRKPSHYYDDRDGVFYSYIAAVSEEERKSGKRAGNVVTYAYLGVQDGRHVLARVTPNGSELGRSFCRSPCRVITHWDGSQVGYDEGSIIGAAFADAINGEMEIAMPVRPAAAQTFMPSSPPSQSASAPTGSLTRAELDLINRWYSLNSECGKEENGDTSACATRDEEILPQLANLNVCYGKVNEAPADASFHRCTTDSVPLVD